MSTAEEIRERRRLKVQEKLNAKYKDTFQKEEEDEVILNKSTEPLITNTKSEITPETTPSSSQVQPKTSEAEPKVSVFEEYRKMRNVEKFEVIFLF